MSSKGLNIIAIGASTGGPNAICAVIEKLEIIENTAIVIAQHMPSTFTNRFANRLNERCAYKTVEAKDGETLKSKHIYVAKGGFHMEILNGRITLSETPPMHGVRPAVDKLFFSVANEFGNKAVGIILTGMGKDGAEGLKSIKEKGGITIVQDEESSAVFGMPKAAIETCNVDYIVPLNEISKLISTIMSVR